jgi:tetratricopeptide (TPR) repeat protein
MVLTQDQIQKLEILGLSSKTPSKPSKTKSNHLIPLLSITGITLVAAGSLIYIKTNSSVQISPPPPPQNPSGSTPSPTQVPKSIQHFLLSSQTSFSQALSLAKSEPDNSTALIEQLNNAIVAASTAIQAYPTDSRGYEQRGRIYLSLVDSRPQYLSFAVSDYSSALKYNPLSSTNAHTLASLYARQGNSASTLHYLGLALTLDPTNPQNFYDLARLQQQTGQIPQALATYERLIPLVTDSSQKQQLEAETLALQKLVLQNPSSSLPSSPPPPTTPTLTTPLLQAQLIPLNSPDSVIIASPETAAKSALQSEKYDSNSLSGQSILKSGQTTQVILNSQLTPSSQVYITPIKGGKNSSLEVVSKSNNSFTIGLPSPITEDIEYKWWIVN